MTGLRPGRDARYPVGGGPVRVRHGADPRGPDLPAPYRRPAAPSQAVKESSGIKKYAMGSLDDHEEQAMRVTASEMSRVTGIPEPECRMWCGKVILRAKGIAS